MPIKPELRYLDPIDWPQVSRWVRFVRAKGCCETCGRPHGQVMRHLGEGRWWDEVRQIWRDGCARKIPCPAQGAPGQGCSSAIGLSHSGRRHQGLLLAARACSLR
jgi:hypothetical protein